MVEDMKKIEWNTRVPSYVKEYFQKKNISGGKLIIEKYYEYKSHELPEKIKELEKTKEFVSQLEIEVIQLKSDRDTELTVCDSIYKQFCDVGRSICDTSSHNRFWIRCKLKDNNIKMSVENFICYYKKKEVNNNG